MAMLVVVGFTTLLFLTSAATALQLEAGARVRGRVMALYLPLLLGGHALGGVLAGWPTEWLGVRAGLVVTGGLGILSAVVIAGLLWLHGRRAAHPADFLKRIKTGQAKRGCPAPTASPEKDSE
jgi:hypothetical protein